MKTFKLTANIMFEADGGADAAKKLAAHFEALARSFADGSDMDEDPDRLLFRGELNLMPEVT